MTNSELETKTAAMLAEENAELRVRNCMLAKEVVSAEEERARMGTLNHDLLNALSLLRNEKTQILDAHAQKHAQLLDDIRMLKRCIADYQAWQAQYIACNTMLQTMQQQQPEKEQNNE